jgi:hypothetical protein
MPQARKNGSAPWPRHRRLRQQAAGAAWVGTAIIIFIVLSVAGFEIGPPLVGCPIKGNISYSTGEHIYHVPGQRYYWATRINPFKGERWFCSENEAIAAGWRKSKI